MRINSKAVWELMNDWYNTKKMVLNRRQIFQELDWITQSGVTKAIAQLKEEGYIRTAISGKGYILLRTGKIK